METTMRRVRRRQRSGRNINESNDTLTISRNQISASEVKEVGFHDMMNSFLLTGRSRSIVIDANIIKTKKSWFVGIGKFCNNYCNLSLLSLIFLLLFALIPLGLWIKSATSPTTTPGKMSRLTILINYDGRWVNSMYENCKTKGVLVSDKITLEELRKKVYGIVNVDPNEYDITMKVIYEARKTAWPAEMADDDDVSAFIFESLSSSYKIPLCITLKGKVSNQQAPSVDFGQESMPVDLNFGTQADLEDNEQYHDSENDLGNKEFKDSEHELENNTTQQCEDMACVEADNIFQYNAEFKELPGDNNMGCDDVPVISVQFDEPNSDKPNSLEYSRMKILQKGFYDFQSKAAKMDSHLTEWTDQLVPENNTKMLSLQDTEAEIGMKWTKVLRTGALGVRFMGVDLNTIMCNIERGQDTEELKEFVLNQPEACETKIGDQVFRRSGDPPLEQVVEKLQNQKKGEENDSPAESNRHLKEEL